MLTQDEEDAFFSSMDIQGKQPKYAELLKFKVRQQGAIFVRQARWKEESLLDFTKPSGVLVMKGICWVMKSGDLLAKCCCCCASVLQL